jgi:phosphoribosylpyrophosphate synthetase
MRKLDDQRLPVRPDCRLTATGGGALGVMLARHEEREFEDGEHKARPLENVRGKDVYVIQ